jgi:hydroxymethylglutaryl-CoA synthase
MQSYGISALGLAFPKTVITLKELARLRGVDANKYVVGLGCEEMAVAADGSTVVDLAIEAARKALMRWGGSIQDIGLLAMGTESPLDLSRPLSAWVAQALGIQGAVRSYEVKHACLGGTLALRQALEWKYAAVVPEKAALVIATDIALYPPASPGEPTQGAGAVAMIINTPDVAEVSPQSFAWSKPVYDFWRPIAEDYPRVDGPLSLKCYLEAAKYCFQAFCQTCTPRDLMTAYAALCFHVPFPKITVKVLKDLGQVWGWTPQEVQQVFTTKVNPYLHYNRITGNSYTASLWVSVAHALGVLKKDEVVVAFSYGSGCGAELFTLRKTSGDHNWLEDLESLKTQRHYLTAEQYDAYRKGYFRRILAPAA